MASDTLIVTTETGQVKEQHVTTETLERPVRVLLKAGEVEAITGWSKPHLYRVMASGELPTIRLGRSVRVHVADLDDFIARHRVATDE